MPFQNIPFPQATASVKQLGPVGAAGASEPSLQGSPVREEGEVPESELDPDTRRRLLILQHGQDTRDHIANDPPLPIRPPLQIPLPPVPSRGDFFPLEEDMSPRKLNRPKEFPVEPEALLFDKHRSHHPPFYHGLETAIPSNRAIHENHGLPKEVKVV